MSLHSALQSRSQTFGTSKHFPLKGCCRCRIKILNNSPLLPVILHESLAWTSKGHQELQLRRRPVLAHAPLEQWADHGRRPAQGATPCAWWLVHFDAEVLNTKQRMCIDAAHTEGACACHNVSAA